MSAKSTKCPKCTLKAVGEEEIELKFGWRRIKGKEISQSWCRRCRSGQVIEESKEDKKELEKSLRTNLQSYANRLHDLDSLKLLLTRPDGLNFKFKKNGDIDTDNWSKESQRIIEKHDVDLKIIAEKSSLDIIYVEIKTNIMKEWKTLAGEIFKRHGGFCLVVTHNQEDQNWMFSGSADSGHTVKHIEFEVKEQKATPDFVDWLYKIRPENNESVLSLMSKIDSAFDDYAIDIQDKLGENVFDAFKALINEAVFNKENKLEFNNEVLQRINKPLFALLYRLVFILYAESREIFDTNNQKYYEEFSLKKIVSTLMRQYEKDPKTTKLKKYELWDRLQNLFLLVENGSKFLRIDQNEFDMPAYNGSLFNSEKHPELTKWKFNTNSLMKTLHCLTRIKDKEKNPSFVNYTTLEIRHIGTIYEKLLEFHPEKIDGKIEVFTHEGKRETEGTYYTPKFIVDNIVENTLGPLVDKIIKDTKNPRDQAEKILELKILDPAMGSGHFLVGVAEYLGKRLIEIDKDDSKENLIKRKRETVRRCLYGVDINPLAVELSKMSLWLDTISTEHALSFLATHLKNGDAILSSWRKEIFDIQTFFGEDPSKSFFRDFVKQYSAFETIDDHKASTVRAKIEEEEETRKPGSPYDHLRYLLDVQLSKYFGNEVKDWRELRSKIGTKEFDKIVKGVDWSLNRQFSGDKKFFHWELEFPQVFVDRQGEELDDPGFDVIIGNPPYGVSYDGKYYDTFDLGSKESYGFFLKRAIDLLKENGVLSMVVSDTWRTIKSHKPLREYILRNCSIKRLIKLSRYAFKTFGKNIDAFTIITEFKKGVINNSKYFFYDFWQIHPHKENEYFSNIIKDAVYLKEEKDWNFDERRVMRYNITQNKISNSEFYPIFEGNEAIFSLFNKNNPKVIITTND